MPYGMRTTVRTTPRPKIVRCMTSASAIPSTNSIATEMMVIASVTRNAVHQYRSVRMVT
jgi:hypothetical protein